MTKVTPHRLPQGNSVWIVRWVKRSGRECNHRFYARAWPAYQLAAALRLARWDVAVYRSSVAWTSVPELTWRDVPPVRRMLTMRTTTPARKEPR